MNRRWLAGLSLLAFGLGGCWWDDLTSGAGPITASRNANVPPLETIPKAESIVATRVDSLGKAILAANPEIVRALVMADPELRKAAGSNPDYVAFKPQFVAIGVPGLALYHQRGDQVQIVVISTGLVNVCKNDSELAAVLSSELANMVAEAQVQSQPMQPNKSPVAEQGVDDRNNARLRDMTPIDPKLLARNFMQSFNTANPGHGIRLEDLTKVEPLVRQGNANPNFQGVILTSPGPAQNGFGAAEQSSVGAAPQSSFGPGSFGPATPNSVGPSAGAR